MASTSSRGLGSGGFRQSMSWLHTWSGLVAGWVLYFMFLTGTFGYLNSEVDRWMRPELPLRSAAPLPTADLLQLAENRLRALAPDASSWSISLPGEGRDNHDLSISWREQAKGNGEDRRSGSESLDVRTGLPPHDKVRETGGGDALYRMHYSLHYMSESAAAYIVGVCTLVMLVAILTGLVVHKKIFVDFFTFRPSKGQRSWLDAHNLLSVAALPFYLMITWSGLVFYVFTYMPVAYETLYPEGPARERFEIEAYGERYERPKPAPEAAPLVPLVPLFVQAEAYRPHDMVSYVDVHNAGRANAVVTVWSHAPRVVGNSWVSLHYDGTTGRLLRVHGEQQHPVEAFRRTLFNLHEGHFARPLLRFAYVLSALAGLAMIGTGLLLWSSKRTAKLKTAEHSRLGIRVVDALNVGTMLGLPLGIIAYFWANRLIPVGLENRAEWEVHTMFIAWGLTFVAAVVRGPARAWIELSGVAAGACIALPALNALTTERHLGVTVAARDWVLAGFDLSALIVGVLFAVLARFLQRRQRAAATPPLRAARHAIRAAEAG